MQATTNNPEVLVEKSSGLAILTLNRPDKNNALSVSMRAALEAALGEVAADDAISVVLLRARGRSFCGGLDLTDLPTDSAQWRSRVIAAQMNHLAVVQMPKVVIAAVQGSAVGGGASLALSADILLMGQDARLSFPFVKLGIVPDGGSSYFLQQKVGVPIALDLLLTGGILTADEALRLGLTRRVVDAAALHDVAQELAAELLRLPPEARMLTKALCLKLWGDRLHGILGEEVEAFCAATTTPGHQLAISRLRNHLK